MVRERVAVARWSHPRDRERLGKKYRERLQEASDDHRGAANRQARFRYATFLAEIGKRAPANNCDCTVSGIRTTHDGRNKFELEDFGEWLMVLRGAMNSDASHRSFSWTIFQKINDLIP